MKKTQQSNPSRREFLKKSSQAAIASGLSAAIGGCATNSTTKDTPQTSAGKAAGTQKAANRPMRQRDNAATKKLGELEPQQGASKFKKLKEKRMPGWRPDTADNFWGIEQYYFEEEAIFKRKADHSYVRFPPPNIFPDKSNVPAFEEPNNATAYQAWHEFNQWILGGSLDKKSKEPFDILLNFIANAVRRYNAALYWLRRLHFAETAPPRSTAPPRNPNGDKDDNGAYSPDPTKPEFAGKVSEAEDEWKAAVDLLNDILSGEKVPDPDPELPHVLSDMIEVNGYIVSMRVVAQKDPFLIEKGGVKTREVPGSSSSHTSISSAFSSPGDDRDK